MASVNKASLREEFAALKGQFEQHCAKGEVSAELRALVEALLLLFELLMAVFLEKTTPKTSRNSGVPPSQTGQDGEDPTTPKPRTTAKGRNPTHNRSDNTRTIETLTTLPLEHCAHCGTDLGDAPCQGHERRTRIDIVFEKVIEHVEAEIKDCPHCGERTKAAFPSHMPGPLQYGLGLRAFVLNLLVAQMVSLKRVQQLLNSLIGQVLSQATLLGYVLQLHRALERWEQEAIDALLKQPTLHVDETSVRVDRARQWIHVYAGGEITLKCLHPKRGLEAIEAINLIPRYGGVIIHDCWASYLSYDHCGHGLCGSHLTRELTFVIEANNYRWAARMKRLLLETRKQVANSTHKCLSADEYLKLTKRYRVILARGAKELPPIPPRQEGKRGRVAKSDAHNLWERLARYEAAVLLFAKRPEVAFTNNRAERDLRMSKVKQKVSGCFRTRQYAAAYCRISSYLQTMAYRGYNPLVAIQMALSGELYAGGGE
ncbi:MAG: IS66 family transposase [Lamprobacter sp.]|uniref:IS66 family transposase n=1 Tax=Lamprobacter sp. TaxID=3100796 RepID=UPI002B25C4EB|nr:IS66 family transposase [Lamprobacter sp.]MEA3643584.1 IS66 family transposase [Lamprobacter sp.]